MIPGISLSAMILAGAGVAAGVPATLIWSDNFDAASTFNAGWSVSGTPVVKTTFPNSGTRCAGVGVSGSAGSITRPTGSNILEGKVVASIRREAVSNSQLAQGTFASMSLWDATAGAAQITIQWDCSGFAQVRLGGPSGTTILGSFGIPLQSYQTIVLAAKIGSSGYCQVALNGNVVVDFTGNTQSTANAYFSGVRFASDNTIGGTPDATMYIDDVSVYSGQAGTLTSSAAIDPIFSDNFDSYTAAAAPPYPYATTANVKVLSGISSSGANALGVGGGGNASPVERPIGAAKTGYIECHYRQVSSGSGTTFLYFFDFTASAPQITIAITTTGAATVYRGSSSGTSLGTFSIGVDAFHLLHAAVTIDSSAGSIAITLDGTSVFTFSGNTQATANPFFSMFKWDGSTIGPSPAAEAYIDDLKTGLTLPILSPSVWRGT